MKAVAAMRLPVSVDLAGFVALLRRLQVPHRVTEEGGEQVVEDLVGHRLVEGPLVAVGPDVELEALQFDA